MDSEDEREMEEEYNKRQKDRSYFPSIPALNFRLYQIEECQVKERIYVEIYSGRMPNTEDSIEEYSAVLRVRRFFDSVRGFYKGSLDLTGRKEARFKSLMTRFLSFTEDLAAVAEKSKRVESEACDYLSNSWTTVDYEVDPSVWEPFKSKWKLGTCHLAMLLNGLENVKQIQENNEPIFQRIFLLDLPPEILHYIMDVAGLDETRRLGGCCRILREISIPYIYTSRTLALSSRPLMKFKDSVLRDVCTNHESLKGVSQAARARFLKDIEFLMSRPDILGRIRNLRVSNEWGHDLLSWAGLHSDSTDYCPFYAPILRTIGDVIVSAPSLQKLSSNDIITRELLLCVAANSSLRTLDLRSCRFMPINGPTRELPVIKSVVNVYLSVLAPRYDEILNIIGILPNLRFLTISGAPDCGVLLPPEYFRARHNPFRSLERLILTYFVHFHAAELATWIHDALRTPGASLRLTHVKIHTRLPVSQRSVDTLIDALKHAPLQTLALEGLSYVGLDLFDRLASSLPNLYDLTLINRHNGRQRKSQANIWPYPMWEYAKRMAGFKRLRYFAWNYSLEPVEAGTTFDLPFMEDGYPDQWYMDFADTYFEDLESTCHLFLAHCGSLEWLVFLMGHAVEVMYEISRDHHGKVDIKMERWKFAERIDQANPDFLSCDVWEV
ncbi:hypothetical protein A0H81_07928 [Grifola frondosa]|uniref:F-box domain-containing protein n=1 Tax=Grifola frondosa TaxID=5627 RepID=A0A1C7M612_GRIFR|nr:hypothetical protein A0H81_07928 [Grifola frondosa]